MIGVSAADLAVVGLMLTGAVLAVEGIWRVVRGK
jgi:hypothetical protein